MNLDEMAAKFFECLLGESDQSAHAWRAFHHQMSLHYDEFAAALGKHVPPKDLMHMLAVLLIPVARNGFRTFERRMELFHTAERMGIHMLPVHFYSPLPDSGNVHERAWTRRFDTNASWNLNEVQQLRLLEELAQWTGELADVPRESETGVSWMSPAMTPTDKAFYYCMIRQFRPKRVIEVGSGYSSLMAAKACLKNSDTKLTCVEPFPLPFLQTKIAGIDELLAVPVQELEPSFFTDALGPNDILFVDSTHISKVDSDLNYLLLTVIPALRDGVIVHFHDIFLPWDYPEHWIKEKGIFWNEEYLLLAFLLLNPSCEVLLTSYFLQREHQARLHKLFPFGELAGGGSFWLRRGLAPSTGGEWEASTSPGSQKS